MKEQARQKIGALVDRFRTNIDVYKRSAYKEAQVRREFIDPFFEALGWDVSNKQGFAEQYKEVVLEDTIKVGLSTRAPDYSFRIGSQRKFFVEAKKPAVNIKEDVSPSYQLRRYAWSAKLPLSIVTDFEEFSVFNCQMKPSPTDKPGIGRIAYFTFDEYLDKFDEIHDVFSKDAVLKGSFDRYAKSTKGKKGTAEVDREFLKEIESWRELLAKNIALRNPNVSIYELNYAVQKLLDRIIFLRICEDRGIEPYGQLQTKAESGDVYMHLLNHFRLAESKYNSGIFNFDFGGDGITPGLTIDDKVLKTIIHDLYYPKSPYEFSVLGVEILGNVYEQFLGKVIRLTAGHQAKVETKPEVKKAGGVYYTPQYIVEYIVQNTVGKLIAGKTPEEIAAIKVLDPACGSGSFLIGAYSYLLRYHRDWYVKNLSFKKKALPKKYKEAVFQVKENEWYLTTAEKKRILLNNIFGVDIDSQAVEVTKMSLLLKVLEHESRESIDQQAKLGLEGVLPNLGDNIKCGNSLIGPDFYGTGQQETLFDEAEMRRVNVFDWEDNVKGFGGIMKRGGFDCVIGNPPYVLLQDQLRDNAQTEYFRKVFKSASYKIDLYHLFIEKAIQLANEGGHISMITPANFMTNIYLVNLRENILSQTAIHSINTIRGEVFSRVGVDNSIFVFCKEKAKHDHETELIFSQPYFSEIKPQKSYNVLQAYFMKDRQHLFVPKSSEEFLDKIWDRSISLGKLGDVNFGMQLRNRKKYLKDVIQLRNGDDPPTGYARCYTGRDINRYSVRWSGLACLENRKAQRGGCWDLEKHHQSGKLLTKQIGKWPSFGVDSMGFNCLNTIFMITNKSKQYSTAYLLGILNSTLMRTLWLSNYYDQRITFPKIKGTYLEQLPIHTINFDDPTEKAQHDKLVGLVDNMLELQKKYHETRMDRDKELYERQIKIVDAQIDRLVYDLYGLTEEEIGIVEEE